jgi:uncharacterized protein GlcG (DUF336 family)
LRNPVDESVNRIAFIGASRGIGRASALALAASGAQVLVHYGRGADEGNSVHAFIDRIAQGGTTDTPINAQYKSSGGSPMADVVKKHTISSELAQKMVAEVVAKARKIGVTENVAILDDGGNLKAFSRMDGAPLLSIEIAQNKAYTALFGVPTQDFFNFIQGDPSLLAGIPTLPRVAAYGGGFPIKVDGEIVGAIGVSGAPTVQNDVDCAKAALALVPGAVPTE